MYAITGHVQNYAWGVRGGLNEWLPQPAGDEPQAELWFGLHPNGPSPLRDAPGTLADVVSESEVPLLVKVMAAAAPLSIQIHPPAEMAAELHAAGSELVSDPLGKIELLIALEPFAVLAGWRDEEEAATLLADSDPALASAAAAVRAHDPAAAVRMLLALSTDDVTRLTPAFLKSAADHLGYEELRAYALCADSYPGDPGVLVAGLLNFRLLEPGHGIFMPPGGIHAYVQGFGLEVMNSSDNVFRLGMTSKARAVDEGLAAVAESGEPHFLSGEVYIDHGHPVETEFHPHGAPFTVELLRRSSITTETGFYRCVLCLGGETTVTVGTETVSLRQGEACVLLSAEADAKVTTTGAAAVARSRTPR